VEVSNIMSDKCNVIRVKPWGEGQGDFVVIDPQTYDPNVHQVHDEPDEHGCVPMYDADNGAVPGAMFEVPVVASNP
jgi:hypothetical protein